MFLNCLFSHCATHHSRISSESLVRRTVLCLFRWGFVYVSPDFEHLKTQTSTQCHYLPAFLLLFSMRVSGFLFFGLSIKLYFLGLPVKNFVLAVLLKEGFSGSFQSYEVEHSFLATCWLVCFLFLCVCVFWWFFVVFFGFLFPMGELWT